MAISDILMTGATIYRAPLSTALPDETSVAYGGTWTSWTNMGSTLQPVTLQHEIEMAELELEQYTGVVRRVKQTETVAIETVLAEFTGDNVTTLIDGTKTITAAGAGQAGFDTIIAGGDFTADEYMLGIEGYRQGATAKLPVRVFLYKCNLMINGPLQFTRKEATGISLRAVALVDTSKAAGLQLYEIHNVTAPASS